MLRERGYKISEAQFNQSLEKFKAEFNCVRDTLNMLVTKDDSVDPASQPLEELQEQKILVFWPNEEKVSSGVIKQIAAKMCELNVLNSIIVLRSTTSVARRELD